MDGLVAVNDNRLYAKNSFFDNNTTSITDSAATGSILINELFCCEIDGEIICERIETARFCDLNDDITITSLPGGEAFPQGFYACNFRSHTFTGPANSLIIDASCHNLPALAGGATKVMISDSEIVNYDNSGSTLTAGDVEAAIDELDSKIVGSNEFSELTDVSGAYTTDYALYRVNVSVNGLEETTTKLTEPAVNQFTLTRGTTALAMTSSCTIDQELSTSGNPKFTTIKIGGTPNSNSRLLNTVAVAGNVSCAWNHFITSELDHPIMQFLPYTSDNINWSLGAYFDGSGWKSSDIGSNFIVMKHSDRFNIQYSSGNAVGDPVSWTTALIINPLNGLVSLNSGVGVNEISNVVNASSTHQQLVTPKAVYDSKQQTSDLFSAYTSGGSQPANVTGDGTAYEYKFNTELYDVGSNYAPATGRFTAPVTGKYGFKVTMSVLGVTASHTAMYVQAYVTRSGAPNQTPYVLWVNPANLRVNTGTTNDLIISGAIDLNLQANDVVSIYIGISGGTKVVNVRNDGYFSGVLLHED